jgi:hypothetical protein
MAEAFKALSIAKETLNGLAHFRGIAHLSVYRVFKYPAGSCWSKLDS